MPFDWAEFLTLAEELAPRAGDEAAARSAISRAYYAALGLAAAHLRAEGVPISQLQIHGQVSKAFQNSRDERRKDIAQHLIWLRQQRNRADYDAAPWAGLEDFARDAVAQAGSLLQTLDDLRAPPA